MLLSDYTLETSKVDWTKVLSHWSWLLKDIPELEVWIVTRFGDLFCRLGNGAVCLLSPGKGQFEQIATSTDAFCEMMDQQGKFEEWFMSALVDELVGAGLKLEPLQCYGFHTSPGFKECNYTPKSIKITDVQSYLIAMGDLWGLLKEIPDGSKVRLTTQ